MSNGYAKLDADLGMRIKPTIPEADIAFDTVAGHHHDGVDSRSVAGGPSGEAFPVGAVFLSVVSTNPATLLGYGTWSQIAQGQFLVGQKATDTDFDIVEEVGGAKTHTHGDHAALIHSGATVADHAAGTSGTNSGTAVKIGTGASSAAPSGHTHSTPALVHSVGQATQHAAQSHDAPSHLPPYFVVYIWKRTA